MYLQWAYDVERRREEEAERVSGGDGSGGGILGFVPALGGYHRSGSFLLVLLVIEEQSVYGYFCVYVRVIEVAGLEYHKYLLKLVDLVLVWSLNREPHIRSDQDFAH